MHLLVSDVEVEVSKTIEIKVKWRISDCESEKRETSFPQAEKPPWLSLREVRHLKSLALARSLKSVTIH